MGEQVKLNLAETSFQATKKKVKEQFCSVCFLHKPMEGFLPTGDVCRDCREDNNEAE